MEAVINNLRQSQPAASELDWAHHYMQLAQAANTPAELAKALNAAAAHRRWAIREYRNHVRAERVLAIRKAKFEAIPDATRLDWIQLCTISADVLLGEAAELAAVRFGAAIESQGVTLRNFIKKAVA